MESSIMNRSTIYGIVKDSLLRQARPELNQFEILLYQTSPFYKQQYDAAAYNFLMHKTNRIKLGRTAMITKAHPDVREDVKQVLAEVNTKINTSGARVGIMLGPDFSELLLEVLPTPKELFRTMSTNHNTVDRKKVYKQIRDITRRVLSKYKNHQFIGAFELEPVDQFRRKMWLEEVDDFIHGSESRCRLVEFAIDPISIPALKTDSSRAAFASVWSFIEQVFSDIKTAVISLPVEIQMDGDVDGGSFYVSMK